MRVLYNSGVDLSVPSENPGAAEGERLLLWSSYSNEQYNPMV